MIIGTRLGGTSVRGWRLVAAGAAVPMLALCGVAAATATAATAATHHASLAGGFNTPGNILIADQFNNRVIEVNRLHHWIWRFGDGSDVPGPTSVVGPNDAERVPGGLTLISGTGTPAGADPSCKIRTGCPDNRVMLVNQAGHIVWQYGQAGKTGSGPELLNTPVQATYLPGDSTEGFDVLITDQGNQRVIEVDKNGTIDWQYGMTGHTGSGNNQLNNPNSAELLANGRVLIADEGNNRVIQVDMRSNVISWKYGGPRLHLLSAPAFASGLADGDVLIPDSNNSRILIISPTKHINFHYLTNSRPGSVRMPLPTRAVQLRNNDIVISDQFNDQVIEINLHKQVVFAQGMINVDGHTFNRLNAPYDAKVIGDYTGLTKP